MTQTTMRKTSNDEQILKSFRDHRACLNLLTVPDNRLKIQHLSWFKPGTSCYGVTYMAVGRDLIVRGDLGDAIYSVSDKQDFNFWARTGVDYFHGKCRASEGGRGYDWCDWAEAKCLEEIDRFVQEYYTDDDKVVPAELLAECKENVYNKDEFARWIDTNGEELMGPDWGECEPWEWGRVIPFRCHAHHLGLKLAWAQLKEGVPA